MVLKQSNCRYRKITRAVIQILRQMKHKHPIRPVLYFSKVVLLFNANTLFGCLYKTLIYYYFYLYPSFTFCHSSHCSSLNFPTPFILFIFASLVPLSYTYSSLNFYFLSIFIHYFCLHWQAVIKFKYCVGN